MFEISVINGQGHDLVSGPVTTERGLDYALDIARRLRVTIGATQITIRERMAHGTRRVTTFNKVARGRWE